MFPSVDLASKLASSVLDDGDDLHITASFQPAEDNSSVIGNSSCVATYFRAATPTSMKASSDNDSTTSLASSMADQESVQNKQPKRILRRIPFTGNLRLAKQFGSWRQNLFLLRQNPSKTMEYQEMIEENPTMPLDDASVHSIRSTRRNLANGRSLLVKQKAQVIGRPSMAEAEWDIGSSFSSDSSSGGSKSLRSLKSNSSSDSFRSNISRLTGDSFRSKQSNFSMSRAMYISKGGALLGDTQSEESDEEYDDENVSPNSMFFGNDFKGKNTNRRQLAPQTSERRFLQTIVEEVNLAVKALPPDATAAREVLNRVLQNSADRRYSSTPGDNGHRDCSKTSNNDEWPSSPSSNVMDAARQRIFSDSDVVFESQRERSYRPLLLEVKPPNATAARKVLNGVMHNNERRRHSTPDDNGCWDLFRSNSSDEWPSSHSSNVRYGARQRIFSDSDAMFESQRERSHYPLLEVKSPNATDAREVLNGVMRNSERRRHSTPDDNGFWDLFRSNSSDEWPSSHSSNVMYGARQRIFSDSDVVFDSQRERSQQHAMYRSSPPELPPNSFGQNSEDFSSTEGKSHRAFSESVTEETASTTKAPAKAERIRLMSNPQFDSSLCEAAHTTFQRPRCLSDSDHSTSTSVEARKRSNLRFNTKRITTRGRYDADRMDGDYDAQPLLRTRFFSDSDETIATAHANSILDWQMYKRGTLNHRQSNTYPDASEFLGNTTEPTRKLNQHEEAKENGKAKSRRSPLKTVSGLSSPTALSAARMIASALSRPAQAPRTRQCSQDYYWNQDSDSEPSSPMGQEVLWSLSEDLDDLI